jgi:hypothetical protein
MIDTKKFVLAGNATFTVTSKSTGTRFTFKVRQSNPEAPHFVSLLNGADNENNFAYFGFIGRNGQFIHAKPGKTGITPDAPSAKAFAFFWRHVDGSPFTLKSSGKVVTLPDVVDVHHEGRCCRCGRKLTVPESIESGIGPECAAKLES